MAVDSEKIEMLIKAGQAERFAHEGFYFWDVKIKDEDTRKWCFFVHVFRGVMHPTLGFFHQHKGWTRPVGREHAVHLILKNYKVYVDQATTMGDPVYWKRSQWKNRVKK